MKNDLLERLAEELGGNALKEPPKNAVNAEMLADKLGASKSRASAILADQTKRGLLSRVMVRVKNRPMPFFVEAKRC